MENVAILLSTYNGENFVTDQIESIISQSYKDWHLYIRDDGSTDQTISIIEKFAENHDNISIIDENGPNLRVIKSFLYLLEYTEADYYMFCDQDDVWLENKIAVTLSKMKEIENKGTPCLVHTDLKVVDRELNILSESMFDLQKMTSNNKELKKLLVQNNITGCTTMINHELKVITQYDEAIAMHDWWLGLVAAAFGKIGFVSESTMLYRQHGNNGVGAKKYGVSYLFKRLFDHSETMKVQKQNFRQAKAFVTNYQQSLSEDLKEMAEAYANLPNDGFLKKIQQFFKYKFFKNNFSRSFIFFFVILGIKKK